MNCMNVAEIIYQGYVIAKGTYENPQEIRKAVLELSASAQELIPASTRNKDLRNRQRSKASLPAFSMPHRYSAAWVKWSRHCSVKKPIHRDFRRGGTVSYGADKHTQ